MAVQEMKEQEIAKKSRLPPQCLDEAQNTPDVVINTGMLHVLVPYQY